MTTVPAPDHAKTLHINESRLSVETTRKVFRVRRFAAQLCFVAASVLIVILIQGIPKENLFYFFNGILWLLLLGLVGIADTGRHYSRPYATVITIEDYLTSTLGVCKSMTQDHRLLAIYLCELVRSGQTRIRVTAQTETNLKTGATKEIILGPVFEVVQYRSIGITC